MTTITEKIIKIGTLESSNAGGDIYQDGADFFYQVSGWTLKDDEESYYETESKRYPSLEALLELIPKGVFYRAGTEEETMPELCARLRKQRDQARSFLPH